MDDELRKYLIGMEERLVRHIDAKTEHVETALLTEFHKWASPVDAKLRTHRSWFTEVDAELQLLKARIAKLEEEKPPQ
jgi:hypothetical protein